MGLDHRSTNASAQSGSILDQALALLNREDGPRVTLDTLTAAANREWRERLVAAIEAAKADGDLATAIDAGSIADMLLGAVWFRSQRDEAMTNGPSDAEYSADTGESSAPGS
jgi:hypothetical protein